MILKYKHLQFVFSDFSVNFNYKNNTKDLKNLNLFFFLNYLMKNKISYILFFNLTYFNFSKNKFFLDDNLIKFIFFQNNLFKERRHDVIFFFN